MFWFSSFSFSRQHNLKIQFSKPHTKYFNSSEVFAMEVSQSWVKMVTFSLPIIFWSDLWLCPSYDSLTASFWPECVWVDLLQCKQRKKVKEIISPIRSYYCGYILLLIALFSKSAHLTLIRCFNSWFYLQRQHVINV